MKAKVYGRKACPNCRGAVQFLQLQNVEFDYVDIDYDQKAVEMLVDKGFMSLPVIEYNGTFINGFNVMKIKEVILDGKN